MGSEAENGRQMVGNCLVPGDKPVGVIPPDALQAFYERKAQETLNLTTEECGDLISYHENVAWWGGFRVGFGMSLLGWGAAWLLDKFVF